MKECRELEKVSGTARKHVVGVSNNRKDDF